MGVIHGQFYLFRVSLMSAGQTVVYWLGMVEHGRWMGETRV